MGRSAVKTASAQWLRMQQALAVSGLYGKAVGRFASAFNLTEFDNWDYGLSKDIAKRMRKTLYRMAARVAVRYKDKSKIKTILNS